MISRIETHRRFGAGWTGGGIRNLHDPEIATFTGPVGRVTVGKAGVVIRRLVQAAGSLSRQRIQPALTIKGYVSGDYASFKNFTRDNAEHAKHVKKETQLTPSSLHAAAHQ